MIVLDPGHEYRLDVLDHQLQPYWPVKEWPLRFVKREGPKYPGNVGHYEGTTSQEVLRALIDRAGYVHRQIPCWETKLSIYLMGLVVWLYERRAARRHRRQAPGLNAAVYGKTCPRCGHVHAT